LQAAHDIHGLLKRCCFAIMEVRIGHFDIT
jgi:hypothetical protein